MNPHNQRRVKTSISTIKAPRTCKETTANHEVSLDHNWIAKKRPKSNPLGGSKRKRNHPKVILKNRCKVAVRLKLRRRRDFEASLGQKKIEGGLRRRKSCLYSVNLWEPNSHNFSVKWAFIIINFINFIWIRT